jgi:hypothetical protein
MTPCGHNFCKTCINECLDRKHSCPCCNTKTVQNQLIKNKQIDRIITILQEEKEKASKEYFENLIKAKPLGASSDNVNGANNHDIGNKGNQQLSPIETIFHRHMKKSLITFEDYYQVRSSLKIAIMIDLHSIHHAEIKNEVRKDSRTITH